MEWGRCTCYYYKYNNIKKETLNCFLDWVNYLQSYSLESALALADLLEFAFADALLDFLADLLALFLALLLLFFFILITHY